MCGRFVARKLRLEDYDAAPFFEEFSEKGILPRFNIAPSQAIPVIRLDKDDRRVADVVKWGLIPSWSKELPKLQPINARSETVGTSGMFKAALARRRCLIPADGFYEWRKDGAAKQPFFIRRPHDEPFAFAGLWERWRPAPDAPPIDTCVILTTTPNDVMKPIHDRMPVILEKKDYALWLDRHADLAEVSKLLKPFAGELEAYPVSRAVNSPKNDSEENVRAIA